jgi:hypothetical protein
VSAHYISGCFPSKDADIHNTQGSGEEVTNQGTEMSGNFGVADQSQCWQGQESCNANDRVIQQVDYWNATQKRNVPLSQYTEAFREFNEVLRKSAWGHATLGNQSKFDEG